MIDIGSQLKQGYSDKASNNNFLALLHSSNRTQPLKDKQIIPSIPLSSFNPTQLPMIHKQKIKLKTRSYSQSKIKPLKQIKPQQKKNSKQLLQQQGKNDLIVAKSISNRKRNHSSEQSRKKITAAPMSKKKLQFTPSNKEKQLILETTSGKTRANITKMSNNITLEKIQNQEPQILLNMKFGKIQENLSYKSFLKKQTNPPPLQIIKKINNWASKHKIKSGLIQTQNLEAIFQKKSISNNQILSVFTNYAQLRTQYLDKIPGLRYYDKKKPHRGPNLAALKIQSLFKMNFQRKYARKLKSLMNKVRIVQKYWRVSLQYRKTRKIILQKQHQKIQRAKILSQQLINNWELIRNLPRYEIHISAYCLEQFKRLSIQNMREKQITQLTRIFRAMDPDVKVIYVTPFRLSPQIIRYYQRLLTINSPLSQINSRIFFVDLEQLIHQQYFEYMTSVSLLLYSPKALKKIKKIIETQTKTLKVPQAYIVPTYPSCEYFSLSSQLNVPIFSFWQPLAKLYSSKSGSQQLLKQIITEKTPFKCLKYIGDLFSQAQLINSLSILIYKHRQIDRWYFKIDDQVEGRGLAIFVVGSIGFLRQLQKMQTDELTNTQIIKAIATQLKMKLKIRLKILRKDIYPNYQSYISNFVTRGGIIQASPVNKSAHHSISFLIQPNGQFEILTTYQKLHLGDKMINSAIKAPSDLSTKLVDNQKIIFHIYRNFWSKMKLFGYFTIDFLVDEKKEQIYAIGIDCFLNVKTSSLFVPKLISHAKYQKQDNLLLFKDPISQDTNQKQVHYIYYPLAKLHNLPVMSKFFKNCKLFNISFDLQKKLGTAFLVTGDFENQCLGFLTSSDSIDRLLQTTQNLVDYLCRQYRQIKKGSDQLGILRGMLVSWSRKIRKNLPRQDINLSLMF